MTDHAARHETVLRFTATFLGVCAALGLLARAQYLDTSFVGNLVTYSAEAPKGIGLRVRARRVLDGTVCWLSSESMNDSGGTLLAYGTTQDGDVLVHWEGGATDQAPRECGTSTDLSVAKYDFYTIESPGRTPAVS